MKKLIYIFALIICSSCVQGETDENNSAKIIENSTIYPDEEFRQARFSEQEIEKMKRNYEILIPYIKIGTDSMSYFLDLSEKDALKIGVDKEYYDITVESINSTNAALKDAFDNGYHVDMIDFKDITYQGLK